MLRTVSVLLLLATYSFPAFAQGARHNDPPSGVPDPSVLSSISPAFADVAGLRPRLAQRGITFGVNYIGEVFSNTSGGLERGTTYDGRLELYVDADLEKSLGWRGLIFHAHGYDIHGEGITATKVGNLNALSNIEATATTRLLDLWFQQSLLGDKFSVRLGQLTVDSEFMVADSAAPFISAAFGWPTITAVNLPSGGVAYPFASPGVRVEIAPTDQSKLRFGVYNDDPAGPCPVDPQLCNRHGLDFRIHDEPYVIGEVELNYGAKQGHLLPGTFKFGAWNDFGTFDDQRFATDGLSLADPASNGVPLKHRGDHGFYIVVDQRLWQSEQSPDSMNVSMFLRVMGGTPSDRNLVDFGVDGGVTFNGLISRRPADAFGVAASIAGISDDAKALDRDARSFGSVTPIRADEVLMEVFYLAEITPGWTVQPDFQYVWRPGGNAPNETGTRPLGDAAVVGVRTTLNF